MIGLPQGAPKTAITASPIYLSNVPSRWKTLAVQRSNTRFSTRTTSAADQFSAIAEKPVMSANSTLTSYSSASISSSCRGVSFMIWSTTCGEL